MARKSLSIPNDNRSLEGLGDTEHRGHLSHHEEKASAQTGQQANLTINTTHQGRQQDR